MRPHRTRPAAITAVAVCAAVLAAAAAPADAAAGVPAVLYHETTVTGETVVTPGFTVEHLGVVVDRPGTTTPEITVRFHDGHRWGPWQPVDADGVQGRGWTSELIAVTDAVRYQIRTGGAAARIAAINTSDGPARPGTAAAATAAANGSSATCRSRADWGADERIRTSTRSYAPGRHITVHHTATPNGERDPAGRVRAIYTYHVRTNGWADIGYHALIDADGVVYEGRWAGRTSPSCLTGGGTAAAFGHDADGRVVTAAHVGGANTGNYGVSLIGDFRTVDPTDAAYGRLVDVVTDVTRRHRLDPAGTVVAGTDRRTVAVIAGHRDLTATACPGERVQTRLPELRRTVAERLAPAPTVTITEPADTAITAAAGAAAVTFAAAVTAPSGSTVRWADTRGAVLADTARFTTTLTAGAHEITVTVTAPDGRTATDTVTVTVTGGVATPTAQRRVAGTGRGGVAAVAAVDRAVRTVVETKRRIGGVTTRAAEHRYTIVVEHPGDLRLRVDATVTGDEAFTVSVAAAGDTTPHTVAAVTGAAPLDIDLPDRIGVHTVTFADTDRSRGDRRNGQLKLDRVAIITAP